MIIYRIKKEITEDYINYLFALDLGLFFLKCYYDEKKIFSFSLDSDLTFCKNALCQLLRLNFKNKSDFLTTISRLNCPPLPDSVSVELHCIERGGSREKMTSSTYQFNFSMCEPS